MSDELLSDPIDSLFGESLRLLHELTGLPVVVGGAASVASRGCVQQLVISHLRGTITDALSGLVVPAGRGLGGMAIARARPCVVNDYASSRAITHHYDRQVVEYEKVTSAFAVPIHAAGRVVGVLGGGCRDESAIGDVILRRAEGVAYMLGRDIASSLRASAPPAHALRTARGEALTDILAVALHVTDPDLRARLERAHRTLVSSRASPVAPPRAVVLAPRELDSLRLAAVGASNAEIAADLGLSTTTVKAYLRSAMRKLDVHNRTAATHAARIAGLI
jgi:DNA-binding CsgD family transcriptional regulator